MEKKQLDQRYRVIFAVWAALAGGTAVFTAMAWALASGILPGQSWSASLDPGLVRLVLVVPVLSMVGGVLVRRSAQTRGRPGEGAMERYQTRAIVGWALQEGGGLFGVVLGLLAGEAGWVLALGGLAVFALLLTRPARSELNRLYPG